MESIAPKIGCVRSTLLDWVKQTEIDAASAFFAQAELETADSSREGLH